MAKAGPPKIPKLPKNGTLLLEYANPAVKGAEVYICFSKNNVTVGDTRKRRRNGALRDLGKKFWKTTTSPSEDRALAAAFYEQVVRKTLDEGYVLSSKKTVPAGRAWSFPI